jgi:hypothetical protein
MLRARFASHQLEKLNKEATLKETATTMEQAVTTKEQAA